MRHRESVRYTVSAAVTMLALALVPTHAAAQTGTLVGRIADSAGTAITHAVVHVDGATLNALSDANGGYRLTQLAGGMHVIIARAFGFAPESVTVTTVAGETMTRNLTMHASTQRLAEVVVRESPRMAETKAAALAKQQNADNFVAVL